MPEPRRWSLRTVGIAAAAVAIVLVAIGVFGRMRHERSLATWTQANATPVVAVIRPIRAAKSGGGLALPGALQAYNSAAIYARTIGYVRRWLVDIGDPVCAGQTLALLDAPEVEQQVAQARAQLQTARANRALAASTATRWRDLLAKDAVSKQETDEKLGDLAAKSAIADAAELRRLGAQRGGGRSAIGNDAGRAPDRQSRPRAQARCLCAGDVPGQRRGIGDPPARERAGGEMRSRRASCDRTACPRARWW